MVLKVVRGKILETLELGDSSTHEKPLLPRKLYKTHGRDFTASGGWRQNLGNMGVMAFAGRTRFRLGAGHKGCSRRTQRVGGPEAAPVVRLSKIEDYLADNLCVPMLSRVRGWVQEESGWGCGAVPELGIWRQLDGSPQPCFAALGGCWSLPALQTFSHAFDYLGT